MKLSKLYTNLPNKFAPIVFTPGLNVVLAEIRLPENKRKDTHNLGKTTVGRLIDFCLLSGKDPKFFLFKHIDIFENFVFFMEIELLDGSFVTVRRGVHEATKIAFKRHQRHRQDFADLSESSWDHFAVPFEKAKALLDGMLDLRDLKPWSYRKSVGYLLRAQSDFLEVFQLGKFAGPHADWKPFLAHILGFNDELLSAHYKKEAELEERRKEEEIVEKELGGSVADLSKIEGILLLKREEADKRQRLLDSFDFQQEDNFKTTGVVDDLDSIIARLNAERYSLAANRKKILGSLEDDEMLFNPASAARLFAEAGVVFGGQIKKDFDQLIGFNRAITEERSGYLRDELAEIEQELTRINTELRDRSSERTAALAFVTGTDVFAKYKRATDEMVTLRADIIRLGEQRGHLTKLQELRAIIRTLGEEKGHLQTQIEKDAEQQNTDNESLFSKIRLYFSEIVEAVIDRKALLIVAPNQYGHLDFGVEILDESGNATSADRGFTYRKLLCVAFDLALARAHLAGRYPRFVFHDGVLEALDDRKKRNLIAVIREYANLGLQHIITLIDSDLPALEEGEDEAPVFADEEVILRLHDEDESGRVFRMKAW